MKWDPGSQRDALVNQRDALVNQGNETELGDVLDSSRDQSFNRSIVEPVLRLKSPARSGRLDCVMLSGAGVV